MNFACRRGIKIYPHIKIRLPQWFSLSVTCTYMPPQKEMNCLHMTFVGSQSFISLPSFMFVSAAVCESNQNKEENEKNNSEIGYFQFNTFPGYLIHPFLPFEHMYAFNVLEVPYTTN